MHVICIYEQIRNNPRNMQNIQYKIWCLNSVRYESWTFQTSIDVHTLSTNMQMHINPSSTYLV
jgi:hypothetical protein